MKWIGQHIWDYISRFRNDVYLEDISTGTIASGGNLGLDSNNKIVKADTEAGELTIANASDNRIVTSTGGTGLNGEEKLTWDGSDLTITSATSEKPKVIIENTTDDSNASVLQFFKNHQGAHSDDIGLIQFRALDGTGGANNFAEILAEIQDAAAGSEAGRITFKVAENDGTLTTGLIIAGAEDDDGDVNVTIGAGDDSIQNIKGIAQWDHNGNYPVKISGKNQAFGASDGHPLNYGTLLFTSFNVFNTGFGGLIQQSDFSSGTVTGAAISVKGGGSYGTNKAGGHVQLIGGRGTGTGVGGSFKFYSAPAGSSGSSYNTTAEKFSVDSAGTVTTTGAIELGHASDTTIARSASGTVTIQGNEIITTATQGRRYLTATHTLSSADVYGLNSGSGYVIVADSDVASGEILVVHDLLTSVTTPNYTTTGVENLAQIQLQFGGTSNAGGYNKATNFQALQSRWFYRQAANTTIMYRVMLQENGIFGSNSGLIEDGLGLRMWTSVDPTGSTGTATESVTAVKVYCIYSILTI